MISGFQDSVRPGRQYPGLELETATEGSLQIFGRVALTTAPLILLQAAKMEDVMSGLEPSILGVVKQEIYHLS
ncbi:hypothetical protein PoB_003516200 [Plakobranchus ocellatus]|uniref:Uncharacterized protein n=1 Tax=Plakobranchus ocellatus TaxID=259542 RepID=A0AAV4AP00_9GAST|nr:hypothetical protein PoB_003516200 [Plakobranchus ocellatus]